MVDFARVLDALGTMASGGVVALGPITLAGFEVPARISFGGTQRLVVHRLPGGSRVIDSLGDDPAVPQWQGSFTGPLAASRARQVNALRLAGQAVPLSFGPFTAQVVIKRFEASYQRNGFWIPYRIACEVLPADASGLEDRDGSLAAIGTDGTTALAAVSDASAQLGMVAGSTVSQAAVLAGPTALPGLARLNLDGVGAALATGVRIVGGRPQLAQSAGASTQASAQFGAASAAISRAQGVVGAGIGSIAATALAAAAGDPATGIVDLGNSAALAGAAASLAQARGYAARAAATAMVGSIGA